MTYAIAYAGLAYVEAIAFSATSLNIARTSANVFSVFADIVFLFDV
jgi:hypothetical protein